MKYQSKLIKYGLQIVLLQSHNSGTPELHAKKCKCSIFIKKKKKEENSNLRGNFC